MHGGRKDEIAKVEATTVLENKDRYAAANVIDNDLATAWCEGVDGEGKGQKLVFTFNKPMIVHGGSFRAGYFKSENHLFWNARPKTITVTAAGHTETLVFADLAEPQMNPMEGKPFAKADWFPVARDNPAMFDGGFPETPVTEAVVEIVDAYPGSKYADLCISEIGLMVIDPEAL